MSDCKENLLDTKGKWSVITVFLAFLSIPVIVLIKALFIVSILAFGYEDYQLNGFSMLTGVGLITIVAIIKRDAYRPFCHSTCHFNQILQDIVYVAIVGLSFQLYTWITRYA